MVKVQTKMLTANKCTSLPLLICFSLALSSCLQPYQFRRSLLDEYAPFETETTILTEKLIQEYNLSEKDLVELAFFMDKKLIIRQESIERAKSITFAGRLDRIDHRSSNEIAFQPGLRGYAVSVWRERVFPFFREVIKIGITFDDGRTHSLTFSPDIWGRYRLETSFLNNKVTYGSREYDCIYGCSDNYLLIPSRLIQRHIKTRRVVGETYYHQY